MNESSAGRPPKNEEFAKWLRNWILRAETQQGDRLSKEVLVCKSTGSSKSDPPHLGEKEVPLGIVDKSGI